MIKSMTGFATGARDGEHATVLDYGFKNGGSIIEPQRALWGKP